MIEYMSPPHHTHTHNHHHWQWTVNYQLSESDVVGCIHCIWIMHGQLLVPTFIGYTREMADFTVEWVGQECQGRAGV